MGEASDRESLGSTGATCVFAERMEGRVAGEGEIPFTETTTRKILKKGKNAVHTKKKLRS